MPFGLGENRVSPSRSLPPPTSSPNVCARSAAPRLRSIGDIAKHQTIKDNDAPFVAPNDMLRELMADNKAVAHAMHKAHDLADKRGDVATASLLENFIDAAERRTWFLFEASRDPDASGH